MPNPICKIAIYAKDMRKTSDFYQKHSGFRVIATEADQLVEFEHVVSVGRAQHRTGGPGALGPTDPLHRNNRPRRSTPLTLT